jgi:hypothetical protein
MNRKALLVLIVALGLFQAGFSWAFDSIRHRQRVQQQSIRQGAGAGQITCGERAWLTREQERIERAREHAASDGYMSYKERARINEMLDRAGKHVYRAGHNEI